jgi:CubicO group peptidase (beta-lactamase class C family)
MPTLTKILAAVIVLTGCNALCAQPTAPLDTKRIDAVFSAFNDQTPGCALGVFRQGKTLYAKGYGLADLSHGIPIAADTVFDLGSVSKQFTALALLLLEQDGKLSLDDSLQQHLPELAKDLPERIALRELLQHTAGLRDYNELLMLTGEDFENVTGNAQALRAIRAVPQLNFAPGTRWSYSNTGYFLAALVAERVSGGSLDALLQARVFKPLGMKASHVRTDHRQVVPRRASAYAPGETKGEWRFDQSNWNQAGDGAVQSNMQDLARWDAELNQPRVLSAALVQALRRPGQLRNGTPIAYGLGQVSGQYRGLPRWSHGGSWAGYRAFQTQFPQQQTGVALTCNAANSNVDALAQRVVDVVLEGAFTEAPPAANDATPAGFDAQRFVGAYLHADGYGALRLSQMPDASLRMQIGFGASPMRAAALDALQNMSGSLRLQLEATDRQLRLTRRADPLRSEVYHRLPEFNAEPAALQALIGQYRQEALGSTLSLVADGSGLKLQVNEDTEQQRPLQPLAANLLSGPGVVLRIERDAQGRVTGLAYSSERVRGLLYKRQ